MAPWWEYLSPSHYTFRETLAKRGLARGLHAPVLKGGRPGGARQRIVHALGRDLIGAWKARAGGVRVGEARGILKKRTLNLCGNKEGR